MAGYGWDRCLQGSKMRIPPWGSQGGVGGAWVSQELRKIGPPRTVGHKFPFSGLIFPVRDRSG